MKTEGGTEGRRGGRRSEELGAEERLNGNWTIEYKQIFGFDSVVASVGCCVHLFVDFCCCLFIEFFCFPIPHLCFSTPRNAAITASSSTNNRAAVVFYLR